MKTSRNRSICYAFAITAIVGLSLPAEAHGPGRGMLRHQYFMEHGIPEAYRSKENPLEDKVAGVAAGIEVFQENCALCHGGKGTGHGEGAKDLDPPPANLMEMMDMPMATDAYLFWTISEGGEFIGTAMPSYHGALSEEETWQVIMALRARLKPVK